MSLLNLPEGVHDEIFLKLPAKSILVSRCVCKLFYNLLSKPNFIKNHVNRTNQSKKNPNLLFGDSKNPKIYSIPIDYASISSAAPSTSSSLCECDGAVPINYPFKSEKYSFNFLGSCNGLVCFKITTTDRAVHEKGGCKKVADYFSILNPLTREFKEFTKPGYDAQNAVHGFGYDSNIDDYKLVIISRCSKNFVSKIDVYTMRSNSWSSVQGTVKYFIYSRPRSNGVFSNGALHWFGRIGAQETSSEVIFSFDISNELLIDMPLPENINVRPSDVLQWNMYFEVWGDCVCIALVWQLTKVDVWVMQEYGVKESWIKKFTTNRVLLPRSWDLITDWHPLWSFDNGEVLVHYCPMHLLLCDQTNEKVRPVLAGNTRSNIESYVESIVSLCSGTYVEELITDGTVKNPQ